MSNYEPFADEFAAVRSPAIGAAAVRAWAELLPHNARVLDLGCGNGIPLAREVVAAGCRVHGVDLSPTLVAAFEANLPGATAEVGDAATYSPEPGGFDGVLAWGLLFLLPPSQQEAVIRTAARALSTGGRMVATAPWQEAEWVDALTGGTCVSLGRTTYERLFHEAGFVMMQEKEEDAGGNHYWYLEKAGSRDGNF